MSSRSKQIPSGAGRPTADHPPVTPLPVDKDESLSVGAALSGQVISPHIPSAANFHHQLTHSGHGSLSTEKERSESALAPTAAFSLSSLGCVVGWVRCVCVWVCGCVGVGVGVGVWVWVWMCGYGCGCVGMGVDVCVGV